jgi:tetratricopeptide (TPR) repeat protein
MSKSFFKEETTNHIDGWLSALPHTTEDADTIRNLCDHYARKRSAPKGTAVVIAATLLWIYARVNFMGEQEGKQWRQKEIAKLCGVSSATLSAKSSAIMKAMGIDLIDQRYARKALFAKHPLAQLAVDPATGLFVMKEDAPYAVPLAQTDDDCYYDAMEYLNAGYTKQAEELLHKTLDIDNHSVQTYVGLIACAVQSGNQRKARIYAERAMHETRRIFPEWPDELPWGYIEYRRYLRAINYMAFAHWFDNERDDAEMLFKLLLRLNPGDNQGVRYSLACFYAGLAPTSVDELTDEGNRKQDWSALDRLLEQQNAVHHFWCGDREEL